MGGCTATEPSPPFACWLQGWVAQGAGTKRCAPVHHPTCLLFKGFAQLAGDSGSDGSIADGWMRVFSITL